MPGLARLLWFAAAGMGVLTTGCRPPPEVDAELVSVTVPGLTVAWRIPSIPGVADIEFVDGKLYVTSGVNAPALSRIELGHRPTITPLPLDVSTVGRPRRLETNGRFLYLSGDWGSQTYALTLEGRQFGEPRRISGGREFVPWIGGEFVVVGSPQRPVVLLEASVPRGSGEHRRGWGVLPTVAGGSLRRADTEPWASISIASDHLDQLHALVESEGVLVRYDAWGEPSLVRFLPDDMKQIAAQSALGGYGEPMASPMNGLEASCEGYLWVSVGEHAQRVAVLDPRDYRVVSRLEFKVPGLTRARWTSCGDWVVGWSSKTGQLVLGRTN